MWNFAFGPGTIGGSWHYAPCREPPVRGTVISLPKTLLTVDATRRRAVGQILLLAAGFLVLVAISVASVILVNQARDNNATVVRTVEVQNQINTVLLEIRRAESAARGYLLTFGPQFLADHKAAVANAVPAVDRLAQLTSDDAVQIANIRKLRPAVEQRLSQFAQEMDFLKRGDQASAAELVREAAAKGTTDSIRDVATAMLAEENRLF